MFLQQSAPKKSNAVERFNCSPNQHTHLTFTAIWNHFFHIKKIHFIYYSRLTLTAISNWTNFSRLKKSVLTSTAVNINILRLEGRGIIISDSANSNNRKTHCQKLTRPINSMIRICRNTNLNSSRLRRRNTAFFILKGECFKNSSKMFIKSVQSKCLPYVYPNCRKIN